MHCNRHSHHGTVKAKVDRLRYYDAPLRKHRVYVPETPTQSAENPASPLSPKAFRYARMILLLALIAVGFGFTVLFAILGPLGREVGMSELQISSIIAASSLVVFWPARAGAD